MSSKDDQYDSPPEVDDTAARVLSVLLITAADDLEGFRRRLLGKDSRVTPEVLGAALEILATLGKALLSSDEALYARVLAAQEALRSESTAIADAPGPAAPEPTPPAPEKPVPAKPVSVPRPAPIGSPGLPAPPRPAPMSAPKPPATRSPWAQSVKPAPTAPQPRELDPMERTAALGDLPDGPTLPFQGKARAPSPTAADLEPVPTDSLHGTATLGAQSPLSDRALPFRNQEARPATSKPPSAASDEPVVEPTERLLLDRDSEPPPTVELSDEATTHIATSVTDETGEAPTITLEDYAVLCAECSAFPGRIAATRAKYKIPSEQAHRKLDELWQGRLTTSPEQRLKWQELYDGFRAFLEREKR